MMKFLILFIFLFLFLFLFGAVWAGPRKRPRPLRPTSKPRTCQPGFVQNGTSCYLFSKFTANFIDAFSYCQFFGAKLATIESEEEDAFIIEHAGSADAGAAGYFLGGSDLREEGKFYWEDCLREVDEENGYTNWAPDNPDDAGGNEDCMGILKRFSYKWNDFPCGSNYNFICEKPF